MAGKKKQSRLGRLGRALRPNSRLKQLVLFVAVFGLVGGGVYLYKSYAYDVNACSHQWFGYGTTGPCVREVQYLANYLAGHQPQNGFPYSYKWLTPDGQYGSKTQDRIYEMKSQYLFTHPTSGMPVNGNVDFDAWKLLCGYSRWAGIHVLIKQGSTIIMDSYDANAYWSWVAAECEDFWWFNGQLSTPNQVKLKQNIPPKPF